MSQSDYVLSLTCLSLAGFVKRLSWQTFSLRPLDPEVRSVSEYLSGKIDRGMRGNQA